MSEAPERLWAYVEQEDDGEWYIELLGDGPLPDEAGNRENQFEYVRADRLAALEQERDALREATEKANRAFSAIMEACECGDLDAAHELARLADNARVAVLEAVESRLHELRISNGDRTAYLFGGLMIGVAQVMASMIDDTDEAHAAIRASFVQTAPWAVDMMRASLGRDPLPDDGGSND